MNVRFIRRVRSVLRGFLKKSLFEMLKGPLLLLVLIVLIYVKIFSSEVKSNLNDCSIGFVRKWLNIFAICFFSAINFPLLLMFLFAGCFFVDIDNLFDTFQNFI